MNAFNEIYQDVYKKSGMELKEKKKKDTIKRLLFIIKNKVHHLFSSRTLIFVSVWFVGS